MINQLIQQHHQAITAQQEEHKAQKQAKIRKAKANIKRLLGDLWHTLEPYIKDKFDTSTGRDGFTLTLHFAGSDELKLAPFRITAESLRWEGDCVGTAHLPASRQGRHHLRGQAAGRESR